MDDQSVAQLERACEELKEAIKADLKDHEGSNKTWQVMTLLLPILATTALGFLSYGWNAKAQESLSVTQQFYEHKLARYEDIDDQTGQLVNAVEALEGLSATDGTYASKKSQAQDLFGKLTVPIPGLSVAAEVAAQVDALQEAVLESPLLGDDSGAQPDNLDNIRTIKKQLGAKMIADLGVNPVR